MAKCVHICSAAELVRPLSQQPLACNVWTIFLSGRGAIFACSHLPFKLPHTPQVDTQAGEHIKFNGSASPQLATGLLPSPPHGVLVDHAPCKSGPCHFPVASDTDLLSFALEAEILTHAFLLSLIPVYVKFLTSYLNKKKLFCKPSCKFIFF